MDCPVKKLQFYYMYHTRDTHMYFYFLESVEFQAYGTLFVQSPCVPGSCLFSTLNVQTCAHTVATVQINNYFNTVHDIHTCITLQINKCILKKYKLCI
jgi:hypothetical protein